MSHITTQGIRNHVGNFVTNIGEPARLINFMAEGKPRAAGTSLVRFLVNSTVGIGGIFDPATSLGYQETDTDFGLTLAFWGVPAGPYLYLPVFGPSGARDALNIPVEYFATPMEAAPESGMLNDFTYAETGIHSSTRGPIYSADRPDRGHRARPLCHISEPLSPKS